MAKPRRGDQPDVLRCVFCGGNLATATVEKIRILCWRVYVCGECGKKQRTVEIPEAFVRAATAALDRINELFYFEELVRNLGLPLADDIAVGSRLVMDVGVGKGMVTVREGYLEVLRDVIEAGRRRRVSGEISWNLAKWKDVYDLPIEIVCGVDALPGEGSRVDLILRSGMRHDGKRWGDPSSPRLTQVVFRQEPIYEKDGESDGLEESVGDEP